MKTRVLAFISIKILIFILLVSCGPSAEEQRQQEIEDSIRLENDRRELIERANRMFESGSGDTLENAEIDGDGN
jgi:hypothetical protein